MPTIKHQRRLQKRRYISTPASLIPHPEPPRRPRIRVDVPGFFTMPGAALFHKFANLPFRVRARI